ncbi:SIS domain-containing protein [Clostridium sp. BL-8]|uniref:D-sedoheptulose-7-phosphate isomerase n=1 Tax=Clostridium sp. BL-8 TaxID=349938 RepID=UPI00098CA53F|nr:SIS domain-containing protein [Clostridium sp. BL-8]OOM76626.1 phosphoheptose isomerase 1 [Clostridium sp. BL-8]
MKNFLKEYADKESQLITNLSATEFQKAIDILNDAYKKGKQIFIVGNGGSASTANHFVCDLGKNGVQKKGQRRFRIISLSDNTEKITAFGNDVAFEEIFSEQLENLMNDGDVLIVLSASGNSPNLIKACEFAEKKNAKIIGLTGFDGGKVMNFAHSNLIVQAESYEQIEDVHLMILHMIVSYYKVYPNVLTD